MTEAARGTPRQRGHRRLHHPLEAWQQAAESLSEQGRFAWLLGQSLARILQQLTEDDTGWPADRDTALRQLETLVRQALSVAALPNLRPSTPSSTARETAPSAAPADETPTRQDDASALRFEGTLAGHRYLVLYVGSADVRGEWATLALGVDLMGAKHALGLWPGATADATVSQRVIRELAERGLSAASGLLVVSEGERAFDDAVQATWGAAALRAHCQDQVCTVLLAHLSAPSQVAARAELRRAWALPPEEAAEALVRLVQQWRKPYPGAASYLQQHADATLVVSRLGLPPALTRRLATLAPVRTVFQRSLRACFRQASGVEAVRLSLMSWRLRRLQGYQAFPWLVRALLEHALRAKQELARDGSEKSGHTTPLA